MEDEDARKGPHPTPLDPRPYNDYDPGILMIFADRIGECVYRDACGPGFL